MEQSTSPRDFLILPVPRRLQYNPDKPPKFTLFLNVVLAIATTVMVANIYYCQPLLIQYADSFGVSLKEVSNVPTLIQSGYAAGILFITPLGDLVRRRSLVLGLISATLGLSFGIAFTRSFVAFETLSFLVGVTTCVPQILMPLTADLAPPERRATALSITMSGLMLGILYARVLAGLIANFVTWRVVYYVAIGMQGILLALLYFLLPDFPVRNKDLTYWNIMYTMGKFAVTEPLLIQSAIVCFASMACFTNFWVTLTFLLGGPPYYYSTVTIGLFGLVGMVGILAAPFVGRLIDSLVPWVATIISTFGLLAFHGVQTGAGGIHVAAVIIAAFGLDVCRQMQQVSITSAVFGIEPLARSRLNAVLLITNFLGQIMGTAVSTDVFVKYGWRPAAALAVAWSGFTLIVLLIRGPHCPRYTWVGYEGGLELRKSRLIEDGSPQAPSLATPTNEALGSQEGIEEKAGDSGEKATQEAVTAA